MIREVLPEDAVVATKMICLQHCADMTFEAKTRLILAHCQMWRCPLNPEPSIADFQKRFDMFFETQWTNVDLLDEADLFASCCNGTLSLETIDLAQVHEAAEGWITFLDGLYSMWRLYEQHPVAWKSFQLRPMSTMRRPATNVHDLSLEPMKAIVRRLTREAENCFRSGKQLPSSSPTSPPTSEAEP